MPLFQRKFNVPKFPARKASSMTNLSHLGSTSRSQEFSTDFGPIKTRLSGRDLVFRNGQWIIEGENAVIEESGNATQVGRETFRIKKENHQLIEENNLLKLKIDILLDILLKQLLKYIYKKTKLKIYEIHFTRSLVQSKLP
ncbi:unnamed protein product, partial [Heterobilharzia americana]